MILKEQNTILLNSLLKLTIIIKSDIQCTSQKILAGWQSGYAAACKAVYAGSIPASASNSNYYSQSSQNHSFFKA